MDESYWMTAIRKLSRCACEVALSATSIELPALPDPVCSPDGVLIKIFTISIEGGDLINREIRPLAHTPNIVGYQCAGEIIEVGSQVTNRNIGQRVVTILNIKHCR